MSDWPRRAGAHVFGTGLSKLPSCGGASSPLTRLPCPARTCALQFMRHCLHPDMLSKMHVSDVSLADRHESGQSTDSLPVRLGVPLSPVEFASGKVRGGHLLSRW
jgi:hypothetical protein